MTLGHGVVVGVGRGVSGCFVRTIRRSISQILGLVHLIQGKELGSKNLFHATVGLRTGEREGGRVLSCCDRTFHRTQDGFTLMEMLVVLSILAILIAFAMPRYLGAEKRAYKAEAQNILQEAKTMEWAYYQQFDAFDTAGQSIGLVMPSSAHWNAPAISGNGSGGISILMSGAEGVGNAIGSSDSIWVTLGSDESSLKSVAFQ